MAKDGSSPLACAATVSSDVVDVLPCVPAIATSGALERRRERGRTTQEGPPR